MNNTNLIETALQIALKAHAGQVDKSGSAYILHPLRLMHKMQSEHEKAAALLHDVIEDSDFTADSLRESGIPEEIIQAVESLTKSSHESYEEFIKRAKSNPLARKVKLADLEDNINILRLENLSDTDLQRLKKYHHAWYELRFQE